MDANAITHRTVHANGLSFNVAVAGSGDRLALCLHGFPESSFSWRYQMPLLAQLGYQVWAPDLRGYGSTSRPTGVEAYSLDNLRADVAALIENPSYSDALIKRVVNANYRLGTEASAKGTFSLMP